MSDVVAPTHQHLRQRRDVFIIMIIGLVVAATWIGTSVYRNLRTTTIPAAVQQQVQPLTPTIDEKTLTTINNRRSFSEGELQNFPILKDEPAASPGSSPRSTPRPTPTPLAASSAATTSGVPLATNTPRPTVPPTPASTP